MKTAYITHQQIMDKENVAEKCELFVIGKWIDLKTISLSEINQIQHIKYHVVSLKRGQKYMQITT